MTGLTSKRRPVRVGAIGLAHGHIFGMAQCVVDAGAELVAYLPEKGRIAEHFARTYPDAKPVASAAEILEDEHIELVLGAGVPADRAGVGLEVLRHGKDFLSDKPGFTDLDQLDAARRLQAETGRLYTICFSERFESRATVHAGELVRAGAIGRVVQTLGLGPHRIQAKYRPPWFFERARYGGILTDIASHQMDQFLYLTGAVEAKIVAARVLNRAHPEHPELQDFGEVVLEGNGAGGYVRVDWFTPDGMPTWGDTRLIIVGTEGTIEVRKNVDLAGRPGADHVFLVNADEPRYIDCSDMPLPFGAQLLDDVVNRTETAVSQAHVFRASELALRAQAQAESV